jgi:hypothetical protein
MPEINLVANSNPVNGATEVSANGSQFTLPITGGKLQISKSAQDILISMNSATIWNTIPNILNGVNSTLSITGPDVADTPTVYTIDLPTGLYDLSTISTSIAAQLSSAGAKTADGALIEFYPNYATSKADLKINYDTVVVDFSSVTSLATVLGFNPTTYGPYTNIPFVEPAPLPINLANVTSIQVHSSYTQAGLIIGNTYTQTIGIVQMTAGVGTLVTYAPPNPPKIPSQHLAGTNATSIVFWLTDQNGDTITMPDFWEVVLTISYNMTAGSSC